VESTLDTASRFAQMAVADEKAGRPQELALEDFVGNGLESARMPRVFGQRER
jgi:hypothetical protein